MKTVQRFLCLLLALLMVALTLAACGSEETGKDIDGGTPSLEGDNTTALPMDETTVPITVETTVPPVNETTDPTVDETDPPVTTPPDTTPPETNPPETTPPCEAHVFEAGKMCTEERACTVCGETVPSGKHTYYAGPCTVERACKLCAYKCPAFAEHHYGAAFACGSQICENCDTAIYGKYCERKEMYGPCMSCGLTPAASIPFITVNGIDIREFTIVTPVKDKQNLYDYEHYISALIRHKVSVWHHVELTSVTDDAEKSAFEIRIGRTNRTVTECGENEYIIRVIDGSLEILCGEMYSFDGLMQKVGQLLSTQSSKGIALAEGDVFTQSYETPEKDRKDGDLRILFHNVYAASKTDELDFVSRFSAFKKVYAHYLPDVVGTQEDVGMGYNVRAYLETLGYRWVSANSGGGQMIFYNSNTVELYAKDSYGYVSGNGGYGTRWALFRHIETGSVFGVGTSHFSANSVAGDDAEKGNALRIGDAKTVITAKQAMVGYANKAGVEDVANLPLIFGGDYNCNTMGDPITQVIANPSSGLHHVKGVIKDNDKKDDYATMSVAPVWNKQYNYHVITPYTPSQGSGRYSIDHIYLYAEGVQYTANQYRIVHSMSSRGCADHTPHYVDISFR